MHDEAPAAVAEEFWSRMATGDFASVRPLLDDRFRLTYPQTGERFDADGMVKLNTDYPSDSGEWRFAVESVVADSNRAVTVVTVTDGSQHATAITVFEVTGGQVTSMTEYWPDPYDAPAWRRSLTIAD